MSYHWKPSKAQRVAFAARMQDPAERAAYEDRKEAKAAKRRAGSQFSYESAGGRYVPTRYQYLDAARLLGEPGIDPALADAARAVASAWTCNQAVHHDAIHAVNEWARAHAGC